MVNTRIFAGCAAFCLLVSGAVMSAEPVPSLDPPTIRSVTMYRDRAVIVRGDEYGVKKGTNFFRFDRLSPNLKEVSLRARLRGAPRAKIVNVTSWLDKRQDIQDEKVKELDKQISEISEKLQGLQSRRMKCQTLLKYLEQYKSQLRKAISNQTLEPDPEIAKWKESLSTVRSRHGELAGTLAKIQREDQRLRGELNDSRAKLAQFENPRPKSVRVAEVQIESDLAGKVGLDILYEMGNANWIPIYEVREDEKGKVTLLYQVGLRQHTEEDWENVTVTLSTAEPAIAASRPKLRPLRLGTRKLSAGESKIPPRVLETRSEGPPDMALVESARSLEMKVRHEATSFAFELPGLVTIPRDGRLAKAKIATADIDATTRLWVVPEIRTHVYRKLEAANPLPIPLMSGELQAFHRGSYVGISRMPFTAVGGSFEIATGTDPEVKVTSRKEVDTKGSNGKSVRAYKKWAWVENGKKTSIGITIGYGIPVSEIEEATVTLDEDGFNVKPSNYDKKKGHLLWDLNIKPGEKKKVEFKYRVVGPKGLVDRVVRPAPPGAPVPLLE